MEEEKEQEQEQEQEEEEKEEEEQEKEERRWLFCFDDSRMVAVEGMQHDVKAEFIYQIPWDRTRSNNITSHLNKFRHIILHNIT